MGFEVDPRVCLITGEDISGEDHRCCCTGDHLVTQSSTGLSGAFKERLQRSKFHTKATASASGTGQSPSESGYMHYSSSVGDSLKHGSLASSLSKQQRWSPNALKEKTRRETFVNMLRRMFRRAPL